LNSKNNQHESNLWKVQALHERIAGLSVDHGWLGATNFMEQIDDKVRGKEEALADIEDIQTFIKENYGQLLTQEELLTTVRKELMRKQ